MTSGSWPLLIKNHSTKKSTDVEILCKLDSQRPRIGALPGHVWCEQIGQHPSLSLQTHPRSQDIPRQKKAGNKSQVPNMECQTPERKFYRVAMSASQVSGWLRFCFNMSGQKSHIRTIHPPFLWRFCCCSVALFCVAMQCRLESKKRQI